MIRYFDPIKKILPKAQKNLWPELRPTTDLGLVLYGGTAIALRLGHRTSVDFDFFSTVPLNKDLLRKKMPFINRGEILQEDANTLTTLARGSVGKKSAVKVSFFGNLPLGRVGTPERTKDGVLDVASLDDLMATKVVVILKRVECKDYQDIAALILPLPPTRIDPPLLMKSEPVCAAGFTVVGWYGSVCFEDVGGGR